MLENQRNGEQINLKILLCGEHLTFTKTLYQNSIIFIHILENSVFWIPNLESYVVGIKPQIIEFVLKLSPLGTCGRV